MDFKLDPSKHIIRKALKRATDCTIYFILSQLKKDLKTALLTNTHKAIIIAFDFVKIDLSQSIDQSIALERLYI